MIFIDSWVWIEYFSEDQRWQKAEQVLQELEEGKGIISSLVLAEVRYRILGKFGVEKADQVIHAMESFDTLQVVPVTAEAAKYGADLRDKYYQRGGKEVSYADAIHLAVAVMTGCSKLYSGDPDFEGIEEMETEIIR